MDSFLNFQILFNPLNWLIVVLILIFVSFGAFTLSKNTGVLLPNLNQGS